MLASYKGKSLVISIIIIILDGIITYFIPSYFNKLNLFYPMLTVTLIPFLFTINLKNYYHFVFLMGIIYDLLYSNIFLYNALLFLLLSKIDSKMIKYFKNNLFFYLTVAIINIFLYDVISFLLIIITNYQIVTIHDLLYKLKSSIILNLLSVFVFFFLFKKDKYYT